MCVRAPSASARGTARLPTGETEMSGPLRGSPPLDPSIFGLYPCPRLHELRLQHTPGRGTTKVAIRRKDGLLTTGDMARLSASTLRTVRFYEEAGLLRPAQRTEGGHRLFSHSELARLVVVTELRSAGLSLDAIREVLGAKRLAHTGASASRHLIERLDRHMAAISDRKELFDRLLAELEEARQALVACTECVREGFPEACRDCLVMENQRSSGPAVSVLWEVDT